MMKLKKSALIISLLLGACRTGAPSEALAKDAPPSVEKASAALGRPTFVLVHGALFTSAGWSRLQGVLQDKGYNVVTLDVPGRNGDGLGPKSITIDIATKKLCQVIALQSAPVILVGHSQGGAIITQAANDCGDQVKALVYVAAVVPKNNQTAFAGLNPSRDTSFAKCVDPDPATGLFRLKRTGPLEASFFQDLRAIDADFADASLAGMVSEPMGIGTTPLHFNQAKLIAVPKYYIEATLDRVISIETQKSFQRVWTFRKVFTHPTGHSGFLSQPKVLAADLGEVAALALER